MTNKIIWFNVGFQNSQYSIWQSAICDDTFTTDSLKYETCEWDENNNSHTKWVNRKNLDYEIPKEVKAYFDDEELLLKRVHEITETGEDIFLGNNIRIHVYNIFDMNNTNEYGVAKGLWD